MARIAFLQLNEYELHGLESLSASLQAEGHHCELFAAGLQPDLLSALARFRPHLVGIGLTSAEREEALAWAEEIKKAVPAKVALGGIDPTFHPQLARHPAVDAVCRGEAERSLPELARRVESGEDFSDIPGLVVAQDGELKINPLPPLLQNLDALPFPDKDLYLARYSYFRRYPIRFFMASRGCPHHCAYCANRGLRSLYPNPEFYVRFKSPEYLLAEIKSTLRRYPGRVVGFNDDLFTYRLSWLQEFLPRYRREIGLPFFCCARIDAMTEDKARLLAESGCYTCWYGLESANPRTREMVLERGIKNEDIRRGVEILHRHGILTQSYNIMNLPGETLEDGLNTLRFNVELKNEFVVASLFQPFPGTELTRRLAAEGKLMEPEKLSGRERLSYFAFSPFQQAETRRLVNLQKFFILGHRFPRLLPLLKLLSALPENPLFDILFIVSFSTVYARSHRLRLWEVAYFNFRHLRTTYLKRNRTGRREKWWGKIRELGGKMSD